MKSSARRQSPNHVEEVEEIIAGLGGPSVFFYSNGEPRKHWFEIMLPIGPIDMLAYLYGDATICPRRPSFVVTVDQMQIRQKVYWCIMWHGQLVGDPIPAKVT